ADVGMLGPAVHARLEEGAVDDQLTTPAEQVEQARRALRTRELELLLDREPRHPPPLRGQCVTGASQRLLLHEQLLARSLPLVGRHDRRCLHDGLLEVLCSKSGAAGSDGWGRRRNAARNARARPLPLASTGM